MANSSDGTGYESNDGRSASQVPAGTLVRHPGTGQTGNADGYGGVYKDK